MKEQKKDPDKFCDCCGEKGAYSINNILYVCDSCIEYALETSGCITIRYNKESEEQ